MTAQQPAPVRLLIAELSENAAHRFDSLLRDAGIATRPEIIDLAMAHQSLAEADMMLCNAALPDLAKVLPRLTAKVPHVPVIVVNNSAATISATEGLSMGAADVVESDEPDHLVLVVKRELERVCQHQQLKQARRALAEAEQRCQLLLQSSSAAIAYVHEGMHIYANESYLQLFGFTDPDDLLGLPLIDLMTADSATVLKKELKQFRQSNQDATFDFTGASTSGESVAGSMALAGAEYEGEQCLQITVRTTPMTDSEATSATSSDDTVADPHGNDDNTIPTLTDESSDASATHATSNGAEGDNPGSTATGEEAGEASASEGDFELELELEPPDSADMPPTEAIGDNPEAAATEQPDKADTPEVAPAADEESAADKAPAAEKEPAEKKPPESRNNGSRSTLSLADFLDAAEQHFETIDGSYASVFVAQIDGYAELQTEYGLSGTEEICQGVQQALAENANAPNMPLSAYQWAVAIGAATAEKALETAQAYRQQVENLMLEVKGKTVRATITLGGSVLDEHGYDSTSTAIEATLDGAFSTAQAAVDAYDGNHVEIATADTSADDLDDGAGQVLDSINEAIENQNFLLLFQPIISLRGDSEEHYEVFLRMIDSSGQHIAPGDFLSTAIDNGVADKIDRWVILQSIKLLSVHRSKGHDTRLTINITSNSVADPGFSKWLAVAIKAARLPSDAVIFQITERDTLTYVRQTREFVDALKALHCRTSLSRFGLTSNPFEILDHVAVDFVKLDGSHVNSLIEDPNQKEVLTMMIQGLQSRGKLTIVPMVESANVLSALWQAGANYIQGHYLQEPSTEMDYDFTTDD